MNRHARQARLADVGSAGQGRIASSRVTVQGDGLAAVVAGRYLAGAGVASVRVRSAVVAASVRGVDPSVGTEVDPAVGQGPEDDAWDLGDPAARAVASGARAALRVLRRSLETSPGERP
jgi:hypothetical protein